jgi:hypothetical protein
MIGLANGAADGQARLRTVRNAVTEALKPVKIQESDFAQSAGGGLAYCNWLHIPYEGKPGR